MNGASSINTCFSSTSLLAVVSAAPGDDRERVNCSRRRLRDLDRRATQVRTVDLFHPGVNTRARHMYTRRITLSPRVIKTRNATLLSLALRCDSRQRLNCQLRDSINNATHTIESSLAILVLSTPASPPMKSPRESWFYRVSRGSRERGREKERERETETSTTKL